MARARNIKPGFFKNEDLAECSFEARLCFAGLWMLADREGRLEDRPKRIKGELFAYDSVEVDPLLDELAERGFLVRYEIDGARCIQISKFLDHQTPHYSEKPSVIKGPQLQEKAPDEPPPDSGSSPGNEAPLRGGRNHLNPDSLNPDSLNPEEDGGSAQAPTPPTQPILVVVPSKPPPPPPAFDGKNTEVLNGKSVVCIADGFELPDSWGFDAEALGFRPNEVLREAERFRQYWTAGKGSGTRRNVKGWRQSWSNWLAKAAERQQR
jgi:hypothetical protein